MTELVLPWPPRALSPNQRTHWRKKAPIAKAYKEACRALTAKAGLVVDWDGDVHVFLDYFPPDKRHRDLDNCIAASKALLDGLAIAIGVNDRRFRLHAYLHDEIGGMVKVHISKESK